MWTQTYQTGCRDHTNLVPCERGHKSLKISVISAECDISISIRKEYEKKLNSDA